MKIVHIVATPDGAPWMSALAREQKKLGHEVAAILPALGGTTHRDLESYGIAAYAAPVDVLSARGLAKVTTVFKLVKLLRQLRPDVVHSHIISSVITARIASWFADVPAHFGGNAHPISLEAEALREMEVGTAFCDAKTIASCTYTRDLYVRYGVPAKQVALVFYAVDQDGHDPARADGRRVRRELGLADETPVIGKIAYFYGAGGITLPPILQKRGVKGHDVLLRAIPMVLAEVPEAKFVLVGKGWGAEGMKQERFLKQLTAELGVGHAVIFPGERADVPDVLASFDISVHCSLSENLGGSVESLLMERPMIVSDAPGFADTILHEETGLVVPKDDPAALAAAILRLLRDRETARRYGVAGRQRMLGGFTLAHTVAGVEALLAETRERATSHYRLRTTFARLLTAPFRFLPPYLRTRNAFRRAFRSARAQEHRSR